MVRVAHETRRVVARVLEAALAEIKKAPSAYAQHGLSRRSVIYLPANPQPRREIRPGSSVNRFSGWDKVDRRKIGRICNSADDRRPSGADARRRVNFPSQSVSYSEPSAHSPCVLSICRKCFDDKRSARNVVEQKI